MVPPPRAYEEVVDFIAIRTDSAGLPAFRPSEEARARVEQLTVREKVGTASADVASELDHHLQLEDLLRLAKARLRRLPGGERQP